MSTDRTPGLEPRLDPTIREPEVGGPIDFPGEVVEDGGDVIGGPIGGARPNEPADVEPVPIDRDAIPKLEPTEA